MQQEWRGAVQDAVDRPEQGREGLVEETNHHAGPREIPRVRPVPTPARTRSTSQPVTRHQLKSALKLDLKRVSGGSY